MTHKKSAGLKSLLTQESLEITGDTRGITGRDV